MFSDVVPVSIEKVSQMQSYTSIILKSEDKTFAIYAAPEVGYRLNLFYAQVKSERPQTHDLLEEIFKATEMQVMQVVITHLDESIYYTHLFLEKVDQEGKRHIYEVDARPSDSLLLALMYGAPILCRREVVEKTIGVENI